MVHVSQSSGSNTQNPKHQQRLVPLSCHLLTPRRHKSMKPDLQEIFLHGEEEETALPKRSLCGTGTFRSQTTATPQGCPKNTSLHLLSLSQGTGMQDAALSICSGHRAGSQRTLHDLSTPWSLHPPPGPTAEPAPSFQPHHPALKSLITFLFFTQSTRVRAHLPRSNRILNLSSC